MRQEVDEIQGRLRRYLRRLLKRPEDVEDIIQDAFLKVLEAGSRGKIRFPRAYLYRTARNLALNSLAKKSHQLEGYMEDLLGPDVISGSPSIEDNLVSQERFELFCRAAAQLPEQCRTVLILRKVYGFSQKEVADRLGISVSTVEKHLAKGLSRCEAFLDSWEDGAAVNLPRRQDRQ